MNEINATITEIFQQYENDPYMVQRVQNYICNQLPGVFRNMADARIQRVVRTEELTVEYGAFIQTFLAANRYFYMPQTETFFHYDGTNYKPYSEDGVLHHILTAITRDRSLMSWKYKTKVSIMKRIKEQYLLSSVPESDTIQSVILSLYPSVFPTKAEAKYFLTVVGDNILKKKSHLFHLLPPYAKTFMRELNVYSQTQIGTNTMNSFRLKYHEHDYANCRLIYMNETVKYENIWRPLITVDLLCVASHYSSRYEHSDEFVVDSQDVALQSYVFYLKDTTLSQLADTFVGEYFETKQSATISMNKMQYLWKHYLNSKKLPTIAFQTPLRSELIAKLSAHYNEETDTFVGVFSRFLPVISEFLKFWDETMVEDDNETNLEIDEVRVLFNRRMGRNTTMCETQILDLLTHFYPNVIVENDKYIQEIRCSLWDKRRDIKLAMDEYRDSNDDAYVFYCNYHKRNKITRPVVSKKYFQVSA
jgi:hypothetical protein